MTENETAEVIDPLPELDDEGMAIAQCAHVLRPLEPAIRARIVDYLHNRYQSDETFLAATAIVSRELQNERTSRAEEVGRLRQEITGLKSQLARQERT